MKMGYSSLEHAGYAIKEAECRHIPFLNDIEIAAATIFPENYLPDHILSDKLPICTLQSAKNEGLLWVAVDRDDFPVGYILLQIVNGIAILAQIDVHPDHGRQGLGTALITQGVHKLHALGYTELYLTTFSDIKWNAPFYEKIGFNILKSDDIPDIINNILHNEHDFGLSNRIAMRLKISNAQ